MDDLECRRLPREGLTSVCAINIPPLLIHPGSEPVTSPASCIMLNVFVSSCVSISVGLCLHIRPAVCQVVPLVILCRSRRTALTPRLESWYNVLQPTLPPPKHFKIVY